MGNLTRLEVGNGDCRHLFRFLAFGTYPVFESFVLQLSRFNDFLHDQKRRSSTAVRLKKGNRGVWEFEIQQVRFTSLKVFVHWQYPWIYELRSFIECLFARLFILKCVSGYLPTSGSKVEGRFQKRKKHIVESSEHLSLFSIPSLHSLLCSSITRLYSDLLALLSSSRLVENSLLNTTTMIEEDCAMIKATEEYQDVVEAFGLSPTRWWNKRHLNARNTWSIPDHLGKFQLFIYFVCILCAND